MGRDAIVYRIKGYILAPASTSRVGHIDGAGLKWVDIGCSMDTIREGIRRISTNGQRAYRTLVGPH